MRQINLAGLIGAYVHVQGETQSSYRTWETRRLVSIVGYEYDDAALRLIVFERGHGLEFIDHDSPLILWGE